MKRADLAMIIFIASISILIAYFVGNSIFGNITTVDTPDPTIFNKNAINPAVEVQITGTPGLTTTTGTQ
jgi:hypothetical protein